jgi:hypothetical protein
MAALGRQVESPLHTALEIRHEPTISSPALAQNVTPSQAIASSDVLSQISMFSYREGRKSKLFFRGTPIAPNAVGRVDVEYDNGNAK